MQNHRKERGYGRGELDLEGQEESKVEEPRQLDDWLEFASSTTEIYSNEKAADLLAQLDMLLMSKGYKFEVSQKKYKMKVQILNEQGAVDMIIRILKVNDQQNCVEFVQSTGERKYFLEGFREFRGSLAAVSDARAA